MYQSHQVDLQTVRRNSWRDCCWEVQNLPKVDKYLYSLGCLHESLLQVRFFDGSGRNGHPLAVGDVGDSPVL
jgi:hypothetical protein